MQHKRIVPSPRELAAAVIQAPAHLRPLVANFGTKLGADDTQAIADGLLALRAALIAALRTTDADHRPLALLEERGVPAYLTFGLTELIVVPIPVSRLDTHEIELLVTPDDPDAHQPWRFLLSGRRLLAVEPPDTLTAD
ncbi:MAG TPA: hypothetical protein VFG42_09855 [Baekduia sp.]|uniref:hypothetical protein n=1 Tax=Baekduia sp. TaxID=2600305 RepID=UPI002D788108|nr:hypothetical protein [Baekduia sp.]HET6507084.1 hypothetical protein [Baekduia sp.]